MDFFVPKKILLFRLKYLKVEKKILPDFPLNDLDGLLLITIWKSERLVSLFEWSRVHQALVAAEPNVRGTTQKLIKIQKFCRCTRNISQFSVRTTRSACWTLADQSSNEQKLGFKLFSLVFFLFVFPMSVFTATKKGSLFESEYRWIWLEFQASSSEAGTPAAEALIQAAVAPVPRAARKRLQCKTC